MSVALSLLIVTACLNRAMRSHRSSARRRMGLERGREGKEIALQRGRVRSLVGGDKVGNCGLSLQRTQRVWNRLVVHRSKVEGGFELARFHVCDEGLAVCRAPLWIA